MELTDFGCSPSLGLSLGFSGLIMGGDCWLA